VPSLQFSMLGVIMLILTLNPAHAQQTEEYHVKAAFLFHFAQLVDWPAQVPGDENNPLTVCTIGKDPFDGDLEATLQGKSVGARPLRIRHLKQPQEVQGCQVLFVGGSERKEVLPLLAVLKDEAVLTVGESNDFVKQGGMIGLYMDDNKLRFDINVDAASRVKLKISSRLLLLAKSVIGSHP
jgi:YfiR/HmsC-like